MEFRGGYEPVKLLNLIYRVRRLGWAVARPLTLGVRALLISDGKVVLVRHTYQDGWYLPGGRVERHETLEEALRRELAEEIGASIDDPKLFGVYTNFCEHKSDHVVVFYASDYSLGQPRKMEIADLDSFPLNDLPTDLSPGSRRRIDEYLRAGEPVVGMW